MCLEKVGVQCVAEKDKVCYKNVLIFDDGSLATPYRRYPVSVGKSYESGLLVQASYWGNLVHIGLHSFATRKSAIADAKDVSKNHIFYNRSESTYRTYAIIKCIIPKGSKYYAGKFENHKAFASDCIEYKRMLKPRFFKGRLVFDKK